MALARKEANTKRTRVYSCNFCDYYHDQRSVKSHVISKHLAIEEAPFHCTLCRAYYVDEAGWIKHAQGAAHRARIFFCPERARTCLGRTNWILKVGTPEEGGHCRPWDMDVSNRYWELLKSIAASQPEPVSAVELDPAPSADETNITRNPVTEESLERLTSAEAPAGGLPTGDASRTADLTGARIEDSLEEGGPPRAPAEESAPAEDWPPTEMSAPVTAVDVLPVTSTPAVVESPPAQELMFADPDITKGASLESQEASEPMELEVEVEVVAVGTGDPVFRPTILEEMPSPLPEERPNAFAALKEICRKVPRTTKSAQAPVEVNLNPEPQAEEIEEPKESVKAAGETESVKKPNALQEKETTPLESGSDVEPTEKPRVQEQRNRKPAPPSVATQEVKDQKHGIASATRPLELAPCQVPVQRLPVHPSYQVMDPGLLVPQLTRSFKDVMKPVVDMIKKSDKASKERHEEMMTVLRSIRRHLRDQTDKENAATPKRQKRH